MAMEIVDGVKVLGEWRVSPATAPVPPTEHRLSYFDVEMLTHQVRFLLFFDFPGSTQDFRDVHFPLLRRSLSLTLSLFYPSAGRLVPSPQGDDRVIRYSDGDSATITLAESGADFGSLVGNRAKEAEAFHPLVPPLLHVTPTSVSSENEQGTPLVAFRVTVFPGTGVSIGFTFNHVLTDGTGGMNFLKTWAAVYKAGGDVSDVVKDLPVFDRAVLRHLEPLKRALMEEPRRLVASLPESEEEPNRTHRMTRATFVLKRAHIETLRSEMMKTGNVGPRISTFAVTCAYVWACLAKSRPVPKKATETDQTLYFGIPANCRHRLLPPVPITYFGNASPVGAVVEASRTELTRENGAASAARAIQAAIRRIDEGNGIILEELTAVGRRWREVVSSTPRERRLCIAGSPFFRAYDTDFGWGRPRKVEYGLLEHTEFVSLADGREEDGGVEIGVGGPEEEVLRFETFFKEPLRGL
ncbi:hypothetical protein H6P81_011121 [Aristolochia fimbriata]|uniref:Uncharacterized protein n=1 Tax=Aristolochia fimbriata TaxID=158543 RepID=A0AAV7EU44_ARIFI|nr:hypothetical protein H6P81_011121 [Aristolochia fimbriata]